MLNEAPDGRGAFLPTALAGRREIRFALAVTTIATVIALAVAPIAKTPLARLDVFVPVYEAILFFSNLVTAVLLMGQIRAFQSRALLVLAGSYLFTASAAFSNMLMIPGVLSPVGLLSAGPRSTAWLWTLWNAIFPLVIIWYARLDDIERRAVSTTRASGWPHESRVAILAGGLTALAVASGLALAVTAYVDQLPQLVVNGVYTPASRIIWSSTSITSIVALVVLSRRRPYTVFNLWLMLVMGAWIFDILLAAILNSGLFTLGWYTGHIYRLLAGSVLLILLLIETGRHHARLAGMEARYRGLLEAAPDAMVVVNDADQIVLLNTQAEIQFGYRRDELLGQTVTTVIPAGFVERRITDGLRSAEAALAQQIGTGTDLEARRKDNSLFPIELMLSPLEVGGETLVTAAIRDITERKRAEKLLALGMVELNRSNAELEQFASIASHDLQAPLRTVIRYLQLLSKRHKGKLDAESDEYMAFAVDGALHMHELIKDLLSYSRVGAKGKALIDTSSEDALKQAIINLRGNIEDCGARVTHDPLPVVMADKMQLTLLFQNLVGNGIKYRNSGIPTVHIAAAANGDKKWKFSVRDNGIGIDPQNFEKIFGMFQRLHSRSEFAGTGIGLAICKKIVERHGGDISVESQTGQGSTFHFALAEGAAGS